MFLGEKDGGRAPDSFSTGGRRGSREEIWSLSPQEETEVPDLRFRNLFLQEETEETEIPDLCCLRVLL